MTLPDADLDQPASARRSQRPAISFRNVSKVYKLYDTPTQQLLDQTGLYRLAFWRKQPRFREFSALDGVDLAVEKGERVGIIGQNGAGKTTLLKLVTGNFRPTAGSVEIYGSVQALLQLGIGFHQEFSGYENIRGALIYNGLTGRQLNRAINDVIDFVELGEFMHQPLRTYSMGMNARLQFATATAIRPDILIIDEVLGAGDAYFAAKSAVRMRELTSSDCTLLLVSHSTPQILQFCSRAVWLEAGRVVMDGSAKEVVGAYEVHSARRIEAAQRHTEAAAEPAPEDKMPPAPAATLAGKRWISEAIRQKDVGPADADAEEYKVELENGLSVFRWPGKPGPKIRRLELIAEGKPTTVWHTQRPCSIALRLEVEAGGDYRCRYIFSVFNLEALRLTWITSPIDAFSAQAGERRRVDVSLAPLLLGGGHFVLSASIFDNVDMLHISAAHRYDLLARCLEFRVLEHDGRESPVFHHPADWRFSAQQLESSVVTTG
jgi:homopolymeric O-antigen transport system ATP-binding protein